MIYTKRNSSWKDRLYHKHIHSRRWRLLSIAIKKQHDFKCQDCMEKGIIAPAQHVHHVYPVNWCSSPSHFEEMFYSTSNLRCLCEQCHIKAHTELGRSGRKRTESLSVAENKSNIEYWLGEDHN